MTHFASHFFASSFMAQQQTITPPLIISQKPRLIGRISIMMLAMVMVALAPGTNATSPFATQAHADEKKPGIIRVTGEGTVDLAPDIALVTLGVVKQAKTAREALSANNEAMAAALNSMKAEGIAERDLQTSGFSIQPQYVYPKTKANGEQEPPRIIAYQVINNLTVRVRDLPKLGRILDKAVTLGVNSGGNIVFGNDDPEAAINEARKKAMANAITKAQTLTGTANVRLGRIIDIAENSNRPGPAPMARGRMMAEAMSADKVSIQGGENTYRVTVNVSWELDQ